MIDGVRTECHQPAQLQLRHVIQAQGAARRANGSLPAGPSQQVVQRLVRLGAFGKGLQRIVPPVSNMSNAVGNVRYDHMKSFTLGEANHLLTVTVNES